ncbi:unnamed protein product [Candidula unifasciata]|uniref:C2HC/C3H-type domain-containing protein n=1 Tax=Candidula unifasciata TaxID=100452 RepID=A0A8S3YZ41_9EUPU|nr:unnamed protein product [Candidula unifasciata]
MEGKYSDSRVPCKICGRSFAPEVLAKHANICKKTAVNATKRKPFDSSKQRVIEGELTLRQIKQAQKKEIKPPKSHWREKHQDFINAVRNARGVQHAMEAGGPLPPPPPPSLNPDYVQCPYCSRRFNQQAAERHIGFCKDQQSRLPRDKPNVNAAAKQNARLGDDNSDTENSASQYQVPKPKPKSSPVSPPASMAATRGVATTRPAALPQRATQAKAATIPAKTSSSGMSTSSSSSRTGVATRGRAAPVAGRRN